MGQMRSTRDLLPRTLGELAQKSGRAGALTLPWADVVGAAAARRSRPKGLEGGVLEVLVDDRAWAQELERNQREILRRLNELTGLSLAALRFTVA